MRETPEEKKKNYSPDAGSSVRIRTLLAVSAFLIFGFGLLIYQLYTLQIRDRDSYRVDAAEQQLSDETLPAERGAIYDATGNLLAKSTVVWNLTADPKKCDQTYVAAAASQMAALLGDGTDAAALQEKLSDKDSEYKILAKKVDMPTAQSVLDYVSAVNTEAGQTVLSVSREESSTREYPYGAFLSSVLGFCNAEGQGIYGLENSYEETLAGTPGRSIYTQNVNGDELANGEAEIHEAVNGSSLHLSIDVNVQNVVEEYLSKAVEDYNVQSRACAIVMNVNTGEILAMATESQFDPNEPNAIYDPQMSNILENRTLDATAIATLQRRLGKKEVADIVADGTIDDTEYPTLQGMMREAQWKNKNITELYYPGSVFKLITASAALDSGTMTTAQSYYCGGELSVADNTDWKQTYHCAFGEIHNWQDMAGALNHSCNLYFIQVGQALGSQRFYDYFNAFGFTQPTGVDLPHETRWMSYYTADKLGESELASSAFGNAQKITTLQMASAVAAVVNGGYLITPTVVSSVTDASGNITSTTQTTIKRQVISAEVSEEMRTMMENVVGDGDTVNYHSGKSAYVAGYRIGGKSGTSEQLDADYRPDGDYCKSMSFTAVLPIDDPEIEVFVMVDDPRWTLDYASKIAAPVAGNIISEIAPYLGLERDPNYNTGSLVTIPNCVDTDWTDAQVSLNVKGLSHKLVGSTGTVLYQYPYAGTSVPVGSTIYLYTQSDTDTYVTVPDVSGKTAAFAVKMLQAAGLNANLAGSADSRVVSQDVPGESSVPMGTVVNIYAENADAAEEKPAEADSEADSAALTDAATKWADG